MGIGDAVDKLIRQAEERGRVEGRQEEIKNKNGFAETVRSRNIAIRYINRLLDGKAYAKINSLGHIVVNMKGFNFGDKKKRDVRNMMAGFNCGIQCMAEMSDIEFEVNYDGPIDEEKSNDL